MDIAAELALERSIDEAMLLYAAQAGEGLGHHAGVEVHVVRGLDLGLGAGDGRFDALFEVVGGRHVHDVG